MKTWPGHIFKSEKPYFVLDFSNEETIPENNRASYPKGWSGAGIPIRTSTEMIGVFHRRRSSSSTILKKRIQFT